MSIGGAVTSGGRDIRAGGAFVEVYGKDRLTKDLEAIKVKSAGIVGSIKTFAGNIGVVGAAAGLAGTIKTIGDMAVGMNVFNASMEEGARISARLEASQAKMSERIFSRVGGKLAAPVVEIPDTSELNLQLEEAKKNLKDVEEAADAAEREVARLASRKLDFNAPTARAEISAQEEIARAKADALNKQRAGLQEMNSSLRDRVAGQKGGDRIAFLNQQLDQARKNLQGVGASADKANEEVTRLAGGKFLFAQRIPFLNDALDAERQIAKVQAESLNKQRAGLQELQNSLREQIAAQKELAKSKRVDFFAGTEDVAREYRTRYQTMDLPEDEAIIFRKQMEAAAKGVKTVKEDFDRIRDAFRDLKDKELFKSVKADAADLKKELEFDLKTRGMTPAEKQQQRLLDKAGKYKYDAEDPDTRGLIEMQKQLDRMEAEKNRLPTELLTKGAFEGPLNQQLGLGDSWKDTMAEAAKQTVKNGAEAVKQLADVNMNLANLKIGGVETRFK